MDGTLTGHAFNHSIFGEDGDPPARDNAFVVSAEGVKIEKAFVVNVGENESELIDVSGKEHTGCAFGIDGGKAIAHDVFAIDVGDGL